MVLLKKLFAIFAADTNSAPTVIDRVFGGHFVTIFCCKHCQTVIKYSYYCYVNHNTGVNSK